MIKSAIEVSNLSYNYPDTNQKVLDEVSFNIKNGSFTVLVGPTGCGKTTLLLLLRGFAKEFGGSFSGQIKILGQDIKDQNIAQIGEKVAIVFQNPSTQLHQLTVLDEVSSSLIYKSVPYSEAQQKAKSQIDKFLGSDFYQKSPQDLSGGQQQRVALAAALALDAPIILLDEPFSFLDSKADQEILDLLLELKKQGKTIIFSTHDIDLIAPVADEIMMINQGKIVLQGSPQKVFYDPEFIKILPPPKVVEVGKKTSQKILTWPKIQRGVARKPAKSAAIEKCNVAETILEIKDLTFSYENNKTILQNINLTVHKQEILGLIGANGSGKTTIAKCLLNLLHPQEGQIFLENQNINSWNTVKRAKKIGFVTQDPRDMFFEMNLVDEVSFGPKNFKLSDPKKRAQQTLEQLNLDSMSKRHPDSLSGGQKSLLGLADILVSEPSILILDEPEFGLDPGSWQKVVQILKKLKKMGHTIIVITQDLEAALFLCDRVALLKSGEIVALDTPQKVFADQKLVEESGLLPLSIFQFLPYLSPEAINNEAKFVEEVASLI